MPLTPKNDNGLTVQLSLDDVLKQAWATLLSGVKDRKSPLHTPTLGTAGMGGANIRIVILRSVVPEARTLCCHTDVRSAKVWDIKRNSNVSWLFYHAEEKVQLRLLGTATIHSRDALADARWAATGLMSRRAYATTLAPGTDSEIPTSGLPAFLLDRNPTLEESETGRENFAVVQCKVSAMEWLYLNSNGHRRAKFTWNNDALSASWIIP
jgi:pyridoxamine 5'-phosphate oxidase